MSRAGRKQHVDMVAAAVILRQWLDEQDERSELKLPQSQFPQQNPDDIPEDEDQYVELIDEEGQKTTFEHLATLEHEGNTYLVLSPEDAADPDSDEQQVIILRIDQDAEGNDIYIPLEDEDVSRKVFEAFLEMIDQMEEE